jgi:ABC-type antimicrobial peptide transport system permease subunit
MVAQGSAAFGLLALLVACVGLYGVLAYAVARRTGEIGIRMALGASRVGVQWMVLRESLLLLMLGSAIGAPAALAATRYTASMLFGLTVADPGRRHHRLVWVIRRFGKPAKWPASFR